jgi:hypothetical protein
LSGLVAASVPIQLLLLVDAASFLLSALCLPLIARSFNDPSAEGTPVASPTTLRSDLVDGVRYVVGSRGLLCLVLMLVGLNFVGSTPDAQLVVLAKAAIGASDGQIAVLFAAGSVISVARVLA